ncbi:hypothetical protein [Rosistilla oblonga]|uniref:hypothetical protein n=1 Tax=Rosistilla oblonga TaxID=2527990 RepID=UPI003A96DE52
MNRPGEPTAGLKTPIGFHAIARRLILFPAYVVASPIFYLIGALLGGHREGVEVAKDVVSLAWHGTN